MPYMEVQQTPYAVLCMTSLGGHLSFFEIGGHRWHARPVCLFPILRESTDIVQAINFLNKMAFEILVDAPMDVNGPAKSDASDPRFDPIRRRWHV